MTNAESGHPGYWQIRGGRLELASIPLLMGIVNVTPDSFSDGGRFLDADRAIAHGLELVRQGADLLDIGGESTRPGSTPVSVEEELRRVLPVVRGLVAQVRVPLSIDTSKAAVASACLEAGAHIINDITGLRGDSDLAAVVRDWRAGVVIMHMQGMPQTMQLNPCYEDVMADVDRFFQERLHACALAGIRIEQIVLDPGIGFGKTAEHNCRLVAELQRFLHLGRPICLGVSRKGFLGKVLGGRPVDRRLAGSLAVVCYVTARGAAQVLRVHDVVETCDALTTMQALEQASRPS